MTCAKKKYLLLVLSHPSVPLHNNRPLSKLKI
jgi:hypothetical protein